MYGLRISINSENGKINSFLRSTCFPCFDTVRNPARPDFIINIILSDEANNNLVSVRGESIKQSDIWKYHSLGEGVDKFSYDGQMVSYIQSGRSFNYWDKKLGYCLWEGKNFDVSAFKYAVYTMMFDFLSKKGYAFFHGGGMVYKDKGFLLIGPSGAGKSTLSFRLLDYGFDCLGDDAVAVKRNNTSFDMHHFLRFISLKKNEARLQAKCCILLKRKRVVLRKPDKYCFRIEDLCKTAPIKKARVRYCFFLQPAIDARIVKKLSYKKIEILLGNSMRDMFFGAEHTEKTRFSQEFAKGLCGSIEGFELYPRGKDINHVSAAIKDIVSA